MQLLTTNAAEAKEEKLMSSEGLEATEEEMNEFLEGDGDLIMGDEQAVVT